MNETRNEINKMIFKVLTSAKKDAKKEWEYLNDLGYSIKSMSGTRQYYIINNVNGNTCRIDDGYGKYYTVGSYGVYKNYHRVCSHNFDFIGYLDCTRKPYNKYYECNDIHLKYKKLRAEFKDMKWNMSYYEREAKAKKKALEKLINDITYYQMQYETENEKLKNFKKNNLK